MFLESEYLMEKFEAVWSGNNYHFSYHFKSVARKKITNIFTSPECNSYQMQWAKKKEKKCNRYILDTK